MRKITLLIVVGIFLLSSVAMVNAEEFQVFKTQGTDLTLNGADKKLPIDISLSNIKDQENTAKTIAESLIRRELNAELNAISYKFVQAKNENGMLLLSYDYWKSLSVTQVPSPISIKINLKDKIIIYSIVWVP